MAKSPKNVTIYGRLSVPTFDYQQAVAKNSKSDYPKADVADVTPDFNPDEWQGSEWPADTPKVLAAPSTSG